MLKATRILLLIVFALVICLAPTSLDAAPAQQVDEARTFDATIVAQGYVRGARGARDCRTGQLIDLSDGNFGARLQVGRTYHFENAWIYEGNPGQLFFLLYNSPRFRYWEISGCPAAAPPQVNFSVDQSRIVRGQCATLRWDVDNVRAIYLDGQGVTGHESRRVCPSSTTTYTLRAVTSSGDVVRSVTVNVSLPPPVLDFRADRTTIVRGDCTTLRWDVEYVQALYLDGSQINAHGSRQVCPSSTTTYNLQVVAESGNFTRSVVVSVLQPTATPLPTATDTPIPTATHTPVPTPTSIPLTRTPIARGQQIIFVIRNARFTSLKVEGTNQYGDNVVWQPPSYGTNGSQVAITKGWWWTDFVHLTFDIPGMGIEGCSVEGFWGNYDYALITYTAGETGCIGGMGNVRDPLGNTVQAWINTRYEMDRVWGDTFFGQLDSAKDALGCLQAVATGMMSPDCIGVADDLLWNVVKSGATPTPTPTPPSPNRSCLQIFGWQICW